MKYENGKKSDLLTIRISRAIVCVHLTQILCKLPGFDSMISGNLRAMERK